MVVVADPAKGRSRSGTEIEHHTVRARRAICRPNRSWLAGGRALDLFSRWVLYQFLTGERPFAGSATTTCKRS